MPRGSEERALVVLDEAQLDALRRTLAVFSSRTRQRGESYAASGRVGPIEPFQRGVVARVQGTELYETSWDWTGGRWECECTCPVGTYCKHAYALALAALSRARRNATHLPRSVPSPVRPRTSAPRAPSRSLLDRLRDTPLPWARRDLLQQLLRPAVMDGLEAHRLHLDDVLEEEDPDLLCWRLARAVAALAPRLVPPALAPYADRPDLEKVYAARGRAALVNDLVRWAERKRAPAGRRLRLVFSFARYLGSICASVEARMTSPRLNDEPRNPQQLRQLRSELRRVPDLLAPDEAALLDVLTDGQVDLGGYGTRFRLSGHGLKTLAGRVSGTGLATWAGDVDPDLATRGGVEPGAPVRMREKPARLVPVCAERDGETFVELAFVWPDGRERALGAALHLPGTDVWENRRQPSFVLADGELSVLHEEPAPEMIDRFRDVGGLRVPADERSALFGLLAATFPHLRETVASHTRLHPVRPAVFLDLRDDDWLQIRVLAHDGPADWKPSDGFAAEAAVFEYVPDARWVRLHHEGGAQAAPTGEHQAVGAESEAADDRALAAEKAVPAREGTWLEAPEPSCVAPALDWLATLPAAPGTKRRPGGHEAGAADRHVGWWMQASAKGMDALARAWEEKPPEVGFFGTPAVRRLLMGEGTLRPRLRIESSGTDWFSVSAEWENEGLRLSEADLARLRSATSPFVKLSSGWVRRETAREHDEAASALADVGIDLGESEQKLGLWQLAGASPDSLASLERFGVDAAALEAARELRRRVARFAGLPRVRKPAGLRAELRPYQKRGLDFLAYASSLRVGAILADDMGLGKTVQALAWLQLLRNENPAGGPTLVVCPASVVHNWAREAERFAPDLRVLLLTSGAGRRRRFAELASYDLVVTNYALLRRDVAAWRDVKLRALVLDEAQNLKNPDAAVTRAALDVDAAHRLALTGTPLENRALDLWSIAECVNPGYLGTRGRFQARFDRLDAPPHLRTLLSAKLRPILLRRTKSEVATDLPERIEERIDCELEKEQRQLYLDELRRSRALVDRLSDSPGGLERNRIHVLAALTRLRQVCCHPALAGGKATLGSGKFDALFEILEPLLEEGHKVLLFSQFVECLKLLETELRARGVPLHKLTGRTRKREEVVAAFQEDARPCVFLVSLKAGGTGLNLTAASYVVLFDPWWNPAVEAQAIDRTHRIGQDRTVIAYRLVARGTIEEKIFELQQRKAELARDVLGEGGFARALTRGDLEYLLAET